MKKIALHVDVGGADRHHPIATSYETHRVRFEKYFITIHRLELNIHEVIPSAFPAAVGIYLHL